MCEEASAFAYYLRWYRHVTVAVLVGVELVHQHQLRVAPVQRDHLYLLALLKVVGPVQPSAHLVHWKAVESLGLFLLVQPLKVLVLLVLFHLVHLKAVRRLVLVLLVPLKVEHLALSLLALFLRVEAVLYLPWLAVRQEQPYQKVSDRLESVPQGVRFAPLFLEREDVEEQSALGPGVLAINIRGDSRVNEAKKKRGKAYLASASRSRRSWSCRRRSTIIAFFFVSFFTEKEYRVAY